MPKKIKVGKEKGLYAIVDEADYGELSRHKWHKCTNQRGTVYAQRWKDGVKHKMHHQIMGRKEGALVDHKNGNTLDNRRENLRFCTYAENAQNRVASKKNTTGFKGVFYLKSRYNLTRPWYSRIHVNREDIFLGYFATKEEAALAYSEASKKFHKSFSRILCAK